MSRAPLIATVAGFRSDHFYAAILLGRLKDPRGVVLLVPLLNDPDIAFQVPWSLGLIGDPLAIPPLIQQLQQGDANLRVLAIAALELLNAADAVPRLRELLVDDRPSTFGTVTTVASAARHAIVVLSTR
jgi:HEAT repeat protein